MKVSHIKIFIFAGILLILYSCKYNKKEEVKEGATCVLDVSLQDRQENIKMSTFIDSVQILSLNLPSNVVIGRATRVFFYNSHIFVLDRLQQKIFHFNMDGKLLGELYRRGNGQGEYHGIHSCMVKDDILYVFDKMGQNILLYDLSFNFIQSIHCKQWVENLTILADGSFLCFTPNFVYNAPNGIWQMDRDGKVMKIWHKYNEKFPYVSSEWNPFYVSSSKEIGIRCPIRNTFYRFNATNIDSVMKWNVKEKTTLDFLGIESCLSVKEEFWICPIFIDADEWVFGIWGEYNGKTSELFSLYSKRENKMFVSSSLKVDVGCISFMGNPVSSNIPNAIVAIVDEEVVVNSKSFTLGQTKILPENKILLLIYHFLSSRR